VLFSTDRTQGAGKTTADTPRLFPKLEISMETKSPTGILAVLERRRTSIGIATLALLAGTAEAQTRVDRPVAVSESTKFAPEAKLPWRETYFLFQQRASTQTLGVGDDYQSRNAYYDWLFYLRPRLYVWENEQSRLSLRAQVALLREFTDSDVTTTRGELELQDSALSVVPEHVFYADGDYETRLTLSLPRVELPTSKPSRDAGKIMQIGVRALFMQAFALRAGEDAFPRGHAGVRLGYAYDVWSANVGENSDLRRVRLDLAGRSVTNSQIGGAAASDHRGVIHGVVGTDIFRDLVSLELEAGIDPWSRYPLSDARVCNVSTGCVRASSVEDPQRYAVTTFLDANVSVMPVRDILRVALGYENITSQIGPDGRRRSAFWSPDAKFYLTLELRVDGLYQAVRRPPAQRTAALER
jgi:hypothetical protein